jgi:predicted SAM-dependent methyltransferase
MLAFVLGESLLIHWPKNIVVHDVTKGLPFPDESIDVIYSSHLIEHLEPHDAFAFVCTCYRKLRSGGILRVVTPDLESLASTYLASRRQSPGAANVFFASLCITEHPAPSLLLRVYRKLRPLHTHKWLYDEASLESLLAGPGFRNIRRCRHEESRITVHRLREVELESRFRDSVCMEAVK